MEALLPLMDKIAIQELLTRYALTVDIGDAEGFSSLFTENAIWDWEAVGLKFQGRKALHDLAEAIAKNVPGAYHMLSSPIIDLSGDTAESTCLFAVLLSRPEQIYTIMAGRYRHDLKKIDDKWLIDHLYVHVENPEILSEGRIGEYYQPLLANLPT